LQRDETTDAQMQGRIAKLAEQALQRCVPFVSCLSLSTVVGSCVFLCHVSLETFVRTCTITNV